MTSNRQRLFYRKEKLRGACWEYQIEGGWITVPCADGQRHLLRHQFVFYRSREVAVRTPDGIQRLHRTGAEQWFFPDRWFSLLRFLTDDNQTVGYYVNFSRPLALLRDNYYQDLDLELDLWVEPDGTSTELDRDEFEAQVACQRLPAEWAATVNRACSDVARSVAEAVAHHGPDIERDRDPDCGVPRFILRV